MREQPRRPRRLPGRRARRGWLTGAALAALALSAVLVWQAGYAGFADSTAPVGTTLKTGTLTLGDDDAGTAMFSITGLRPGAAGTRCIAVTAGGDARAAIRLYATERSTHALAGALRLSVVLGTGGSTAGCSGFRPSAAVYSGTWAAFPASGFGTGVGEWTTTGGTATRTYQITYSLPRDAGTEAQSRTATLGLTWEAQSR
jgi:hypothetical protein